MRAIAAVSVGIAAAAPAPAQCPVAADLAGGIRVHEEGPGYETFWQDTPGVVRGRYSNGETEVAQYLLGKGIYMLMVEDLDFEGKPVPGSRTIYAHEVAIAELPEPVPSSTWKAEVIVAQGGGGFSSETHLHGFAAMERVVLGGCGYDMIPIEIAYEGLGSTDVLHYLPELGISYLAEVHWDGRPADIYPYDDIEALGENPQVTGKK